MTLLSASEDLRYRTLDALSGALEKLAYLASLRDETGQYRHWGMNRIYGERAAAAALAEVHTQAWIEVLRTPIPELLRQLDGMKPDPRRAVVTELKSYRKLSCPVVLSGGQVRHFNSVLLALECLSRSMDATPQAA